MLVLSRKQGQTVEIGEQVTITVTQVRGNQVRLGIDAPKEIAIRRGELRTDFEATDPSSDPVILEFELPVSDMFCSRLG
jgi:carbon storage regulator